MNKKMKHPQPNCVGQTPGPGLFLGRTSSYLSFVNDKERCEMHERETEVKETYTVQEVAKLLKCSDQTVRKFLNGKELRGAKVGRSWRICHDEVVRMTRLQG